MEDQELKLPFSAIKHSKSRVTPSAENSFRVLDSPLRDDIKERAYAEERQFFLRKFKEMEHLMEGWDHSQGSEELVSQLRKVMLVVPEVDWKIEDGQFVENEASNAVEQDEENMDGVGAVESAIEG